MSLKKALNLIIGPKGLLDDPVHLNTKVVREKFHSPRLHRDPFERPRNGHLVNAEFIGNLRVAQTLFQPLFFQHFDVIHWLPRFQEALRHKILKCNNL